MGMVLRSIDGNVAAVDVHDDVALRLAGLDQRYTPGRRAIVEVLAKASRPLTVPELLAAAGAAGEGAGTVPQSSAYRNLTLLVEVGILHRLPGSDEFARYELAEELAGHHIELLGRCDACQ